jgi:hypothetical protein
MPVRTPFRITPSLGPELWQVALEFYWDTISADVGDTTPVASYQQGSAVIGNDGHTYVLVKTTGGDIASGAAVVLTEPAMTVATGAGAYTAPVTVGAVAIPVGSFIHVRRTAL